MKIKTPIGYLIITEQETEISYPGVTIRLSSDGTEEHAVAVATLEYNMDAGKLKAYLYDGVSDEPVDVKEFPHDKFVTATSLADAFTYIDIERLDMGDSYEETVEFLCDKAGIAFDRDGSDEDEDYYKNKATEAYEKMLIDGSINDLIESIVEEIYDNFDYLRRTMVYHNDWFADIKEHPTVNAISIIDNYVQNINNVAVCSTEHCKKMKEVMEKLLSMDLELCYVGHTVGYSYFRYLHPDYYLRSNDVFTVGHVLSEDEIEHELGEYTIHAEVRSCVSDKGGDQGYTIAFNRKDGIVAHIYEFTKTFEPFNMTHRDTGYEMQIDVTNLEESSKQLADKINELTVIDFGKE